MNLIDIKKITPSYNFIQVTADRDTEVSGILRDPECPYSTVQKIVAVGPMVKNYKVGDLVMLNLTRYRKTSIPKDSLKEDMNGVTEIVKYTMPVIELDKNEYMLLTDSDIDFTIDEYDQIV